MRLFIAAHLPPEVKAGFGRDAEVRGVVEAADVAVVRNCDVIRAASRIGGDGILTQEDARRLRSDVARRGREFIEGKTDGGKDARLFRMDRADVRDFETQPAAAYGLERFEEAIGKRDMASAIGCVLAYRLSGSELIPVLARMRAEAYASDKSLFAFVNLVRDARRGAGQDELPGR